ncbi:transportin-3 [Nymphalis io]|uniref:transportin-3 n=1 Tax=Inachis io TaxID=171585 RepID=UPI002166F211|nr:transportin-3 [Nymphalis io]
MEAPSMDTIYQAINALYDNPNPNEKEKASRWLGEVQKSIHSWKVADQLLQQKKDVHSCYFAAQTMRSKVQHNLSELPQEAVVSLRDSLVAHLEGISPDTSSAIVTQLSLALADLALQMTSWSNCVGDLIKLFSNKNDFVLLEVLTVLPQEIDSSSLKLGENRREEIKSELRANSQLVTFFLKECLNSSQSTNIALKIVKCMTSWIQVRAMSIQEVPQNAVIGFSLQVLRDHNSINLLHSAASDCICAILHCLEDNNNNTDVEKLLFDSVSALEESYHMAVAHEEEEKAANYAGVFTELAETFLEKIILCAANGNAHFAMRSLELSLVCVGHHDYDVAEITFNLWYRLSEEVYERDYQPLTDVFKPHIERLIEALARHCQCEPDHTQLPDEGDEFYEFRMKVMELIKDVVFIVGSSSVFRQMFAVLQADLPWEQTEAALFIMQSVAKNILPEEYEYVPKVVEAILSMPEGTHPAVRKTCILLLGELCEWIERHPECLEPCLQSLIGALQDQSLAGAAATALQNICAACRSHAAPHAATLLRAARRADDLSLAPRAAAALLRALAAAVGRLPPEQLALAMREAAAVQLEGLRELLAREAEPRRGTRSDPVLWLDRLAALFRDVDAPAGPASHPCLPAFRDAWPVVHEVMNKFSREGRIMERACRSVRFMVRCTGRHAAPLLPALAQALPALYAARAHSCLLYLAAVLADALADPTDAAAQRALSRLLHALLPPALSLLAAPDALRDNPDTVDDLYRLCVRYLQRSPGALLAAEGALPQLLSLGARACALDHRDANCSLMKFLHDLARIANSTRDDDRQVKEAISATLTQYGETLTFALLEASVLHLHSYMLSEVAEVMLELVWWQKRAGADWLASALRRLSRAPPAATDHQCWQFHQYAIRAEKCKEMTRLLRDFARLYR